MIFTRPATAEDHDFIMSGWSSSYRMSRDCTTPMALYAKQKHEEIEHHLSHSFQLVAHGETGLLFGFIAYDPSTYVARTGSRHRVTLTGYVHYVYVAGPFRRRGISRRLFAAAGISPTQRFGYACRTRWSWKLSSKIQLAEYEPYRARFEDAEHERRADRAQVAGDAEEPGQDPGR